MRSIPSGVYPWNPRHDHEMHEPCTSECSEFELTAKYGYDLFSTYYDTEH